VKRRDVGFTEVLELGCSCEDVFWHMIHPDTASTVDPTIVEWRANDFPPRAGTLNHLKVKGPLGVRLKVRSRFAEFEAPTRMVIEGVKPFITKWTRGTHDLTTIPDGTRYSYTVEMRPPFVFRPAYRVMSRRMQRGVREGCERLVQRFGVPRT
jgi:hypothetical protein